MKKLIIASVSVLALSAGAAFADDPIVYNSDATITQEGSTNTASVEQIAGTSTNTAVVEQAGKGNALIYQSNGDAAQSAKIYQKGTDDASEQAAVKASVGIVSIDVDAGAKIYQNSSTYTVGTSAANTAEVTQYSNTHGALVIQGGEGGSNEAYVTQGTDTEDMGSTGNTAFVGQDTSAAAANNIATIKQNTTSAGGGNLAMVYQH